MSSLPFAVLLYCTILHRSTEAFFGSLLDQLTLGGDIDPKYYNFGKLSYLDLPPTLPQESLQDDLECGMRYAVNSHKPVISYGFEAKRLEFPWHVALFKQYNPTDEPEYICGGSIIQRNIIVTAAHCIYNESVFGIDSATFTVVAGKYYRQWNYSDPLEQKFKVTELRIPKTYSGVSNRYADDIAVLALNDSIKFGSAVMPVCVDWASQLYKDRSKVPGTIVGWGYNEHGNLSNELMVAKLNYFDFTSCRDIVDEDFSSFVTSDKFCAGVDTGTAVEPGDSGGGFVVPSNSTGDMRYYLYGIVSTKDTQTNKTAAFTDMSAHLSWIKSTMESIKNLGYCTRLRSTKVELTQCSNNGSAVGCEDVSKQGTKAKLRCKSSFFTGAPYGLKRDIECFENRTWAPLVESCIECGIRPEGFTSEVRNSPEPWHVGIFNEDFDYLCGGTLFHPRAVLTAANCIYGQENETFYAAIGKHNCGWNIQEVWEQKFTVSKTFIKSSYVGLKEDFIDDIAILELNDTVRLDQHVMPACIDWSRALQLYKNPLIPGVSVGCGNINSPSKEKTVNTNKLKYIDREQCEKFSLSQYPLAADKICAITDDGSADLDNGYAGGSLTYPYYSKETGQQMSYLYGVISHVFDNVVRSTDVAYHLEWIQDILTSHIVQNKVSTTV